MLLALRRPDGTMPAIGDADGGRLLPLGAAAPDDCRGVFFAVGGRCSAAPTTPGPPGGVAPERLWLLGDAGLAAFAACEPRPPAASASRALRARAATP